MAFKTPSCLLKNKTMRPAAASERLSDRGIAVLICLSNVNRDCEIERKRFDANAGNVAGAYFKTIDRSSLDAI